MQILTGTEVCLDDMLQAATDSWSQVEVFMLSSYYVTSVANLYMHVRISFL